MISTILNTPTVIMDTCVWQILHKVNSWLILVVVSNRVFICWDDWNINGSLLILGHHVYDFIHVFFTAYDLKGCEELSWFSCLWIDSFCFKALFLFDLFHFVSFLLDILSGLFPQFLWDEIIGSSNKLISYRYHQASNDHSFWKYFIHLKLY